VSIKVRITSISVVRLTTWRSAAKPHAGYLNAHRMQRGFVCCNGLLGGGIRASSLKFI
jgi:hypothetical protein